MLKVITNVALSVGLLLIAFVAVLGQILGSIDQPIATIAVASVCLIAAVALIEDARKTYATLNRYR